MSCFVGRQNVRVCAGIGLAAPPVGRCARPASRWVVLLWPLNGQRASLVSREAIADAFNASFERNPRSTSMSSGEDQDGEEAGRCRTRDWTNRLTCSTKGRLTGLGAVLAHNRDEEKEHAVMTLEWIRRQDPGDFVLDCGEDLCIGYRDHDAEAVRLSVEESMTFRVLEPSVAVALRRHSS